MKFGTILLWTPGQRAEFEARCRSAEQLGFEMIGVGESPNAYRDWPVALSEAALSTGRARLAVAVAAPHGRHPVVTANALSTLQEVSGDRVIYGIGTGGSATAAIGRGAATLDELRQYVVAVRSLLNGEPTVWDGRPCPPMTGTRATPIFMSAYGPAAMRLAGEIADGVILAVGASPELIERFGEQVAQGAESVGRDPAQIEKWVMARVAVRPTRDEAIGDVQANLASAGAFGLKSAAQMELVPDEHRDAVRVLQRRYDPTKHVMWDGPNSRLVTELGLRDYLARRFGVIGTPQECREQVAEMEAAGVTALLAPAVDHDPDGLLQRLARDLMTQ